VPRARADLDQKARSGENRPVAYTEAAPGPALAPFVERWCFSRDERPGAPPAMRVVPDGAIDVLFSLALDGSSGEAQVFGMKTRPLLVETAGPRENLLLRLRPGLAARAFGVAAHELTDRALPLDEVAGTQARGWLARLAETRGRESRTALLERELGRWLRRRGDGPDATDALVQRAAAELRREIPPSIAALARSLGVSERRLERAFGARVGVSPKLYARIARFHRAYRALAAGGDPLDAALAHGYFDQAHLNRDFRALAGEPPRRIFPSPRV
jgi:AraC-like DNA-binding protein